MTAEMAVFISKPMPPLGGFFMPKKGVATHGTY